MQTLLSKEERWLAARLTALWLNREQLRNEGTPRELKGETTVEILVKRVTEERLEGLQGSCVSIDGMAQTVNVHGSIARVVCLLQCMSSEMKFDTLLVEN